jgi:hypothetical protein
VIKVVERKPFPEVDGLRMFERLDETAQSAIEKFRVEEETDDALSTARSQRVYRRAGETISREVKRADFI